ncbi:hypothetical protein JTE90_027091 [Oedothorax gibbosus]|uniref:Uncharacterized protein n=1 Tax=Oedothorax gibbosus TaxID=931172 RepID=A0AAV6TE79_9ARAC|nr:hypothetical protein JTE90_027091 [Oedothorax gibbosus]
MFPLASSCPGHSFTIFRVPTCALKLRHFHKWNAAGHPVRPALEGTGIPECGRPPPACTFISPPGVFRPIDIAHMLDSWFRVSKTGSGG